MEKVYQVFVSSTFSDLQDERKQVSDTLAKSGFIPSGMELFPATDQQQLEFIKRVIDRCDYYVVIVGARYGSLDGDKSFTEKEFEYAVEKKIPVLAFLHKYPGKIESDKSDRDPDQIKRLDSFRSRLKTSRIVAFWSDVHDLRTEVLTAVTNAVNLAPGVGWVRGDQAIDPKVLQEFEKLRIENEQLKLRVVELEGEDIGFPAELLGPADDFHFTIIGHGSNNKFQTISAQQEIGSLFSRIVNALIAENSEQSIGNSIAEEYARSIPSDYDKNLNYRMSPNDLTTLRFHLEALGLIKAVGRESVHKIGDMEMRNEFIAWSITEKGRKFISNMRAVRHDE